MATPVVVWDDRFREYDFGPGHPFSETSRWLACRLLEEWERESGSPHLEWIREVPEADAATLAQFHAPAYLDRVRTAGATSRRALLDRGDTPSFPGCYSASLRLVEGTRRAAGAARRPGGRAFAPAGGLHHAHPDRASGFCIFNDLAVAIAASLSEGLARVAYLDLDVHHGDGVMYGFYGDDRVLDIDFHESGRTIFPGTGEPYETGVGPGAGRKVNVPLPAGTGDGPYLRLFDRLVPGLLREFRPELIVVQSGADGRAGDALGHLDLSPRPYRHALDVVLAEAGRSGSGVLVTGGGGYEPANVATLLAAAGARLADDLPIARPGRSLPEAWRAEFTRATGRPAPSRMPEDDPASADGPEPWETRLLSTLEAALGERFPEPLEE